MTDLAGMLDDIRSNLDVAAVSYTDASQPFDVYEGFLFSLIVATAEDLGATVWFEDCRQSPTSNLVFRTSPGLLHSTARPYTHAVIAFDGTPEIEVHVGVYVLGNSGVPHECDVVAVERDEANECRAVSRIPKSKKCPLTVESKYYVTRGVPLGQARSFVGLSADLGTKPAKLLVANVASSNARKYLEKRNEQWEHGVLPGTQRIDSIKEAVRKAFRRYNPALDI